MATRTIESATSSGLAATYNVTSAAVDRVAPGSILHVKNTNAGACTVTLTTPETRDGDLAVGDRTVSVPATTGERFIAVPTSTTYRDPADGLVGVGFSPNGATVTYAVIRGAF